MTDQEIIKGLIERDRKVTEDFFFTQCRPLFCNIINLVFSYDVDYDEFVNELYVYLMENDAQKLRDFEYRSSVYTWLKVLAIRYFIKKRDHLIDDSPQKPLYEEPVQSDEKEERLTAESDLERLLFLMPNYRYAYVIRKLMLEDCEPEGLADEMGVTTANLYNIKRRAMAQLTQIALNDIKEYGKK
ncbi:MAG: sigma-70 family RNA polymerase sigma factor [Bacteroidaceae bacterium]|nr:sigma-70 family RNA polymerase sigma factor [Bacteroidaceae bacterium]